MAANKTVLDASKNVPTNLPVLISSDAYLSPQASENVGRGGLLRQSRGSAHLLQPLIRTPSKQEMGRGRGRGGEGRAGSDALRGGQAEMRWEEGRLITKKIGGMSDEEHAYLYPGRSMSSGVAQHG